MLNLLVPPKLRKINKAGCVFEGHGSKVPITVNKLSAKEHRKKYSKSVQEPYSQVQSTKQLITLY